MASRLEVPPRLAARLPPGIPQRIPSDWAAAREERSAAAVEWRCSKNWTGEESLEPLWPERNGYRPGRRRRPPAPDATELTLYGYDQAGRVVIAVDRDGLGDDSTERLIWRDGEEELARAATSATPALWPPRLDAVWHAELADGNPVLVEHIGEWGSRIERLRWDGKRLVEAANKRLDEEGSDFRDVLAWDERGLLRIARLWPEGPEIVYQRRPRGVTLGGMLRSLEDELVERIPMAISAGAFNERLRACPLVYSLGNAYLPPVIVLCPESVRQGLAAEHGPDPWYRWQAAEWPAVADVPQIDGYGDEDFPERCRTAAREIMLFGEGRRAPRLLRAVARRLNERDRNRSLDVRGDFTVYPWEVEGEALEVDLAASSPPGRRAAR